MSTLVKTESLTKSYGRNRGITDINLEIEEGEVFGFLGPNGAGKTTTMRVLMGLLRPTSGHASIQGFDCWSQAVEVKRLVGYLPGEFSFDGSMKGSEIITYLANLRGGVDKQFIASLVERLEFDPSKKFREYSRGNKQKVGLIQAFMHRPRLLILDEPTGSLDPLNQQSFYQLVSEAKANGQTIFLSSHILSEVEQTCDRVSIIRAGRFVAISPVAGLKDMKQHKVTLRFPTALSTDPFTHLGEVLEAHTLNNGQTIELTVQGDLQNVIRIGAQNAATNITSHEPTLEEVFLQYYKDDIIPASRNRGADEVKARSVTK